MALLSEGREREEPTGQAWPGHQCLSSPLRSTSKDQCSPRGKVGDRSLPYSFLSCWPLQRTTAMGWRPVPSDCPRPKATYSKQQAPPPLVATVTHWLLLWPLVPCHKSGPIQPSLTPDSSATCCLQGFLGLDPGWIQEGLCGGKVKFVCLYCLVCLSVCLPVLQL